MSTQSWQGLSCAEAQRERKQTHTPRACIPHTGIPYTRHTPTPHIPYTHLHTSHTHTTHIYTHHTLTNTHTHTICTSHTYTTYTIYTPTHITHTHHSHTYTYHTLTNTHTHTIHVTHIRHIYHIHTYTHHTHTPHTHKHSHAHHTHVTYTLLPSQIPGDSPIATGVLSLDSSPWPRWGSVELRGLWLPGPQLGGLRGPWAVSLLSVPLQAQCLCTHRPQQGQAEQLPVWVCVLGAGVSWAASQALPRDRGTAQQHGPWWEQPTLAALPLPLATQGDLVHHHSPPPLACTVHPCVSVRCHSAPCSCFVS